MGSHPVGVSPVCINALAKNVRDIHNFAPCVLRKRGLQGGEFQNDPLPSIDVYQSNKHNAGEAIATSAQIPPRTLLGVSCSKDHAAGNGPATHFSSRTFALELEFGSRPGIFVLSTPLCKRGLERYTASVLAAM
jgi:hypothetical protein